MHAARLDLRERTNSGCLGCDRLARKDFLENGLCKQTVSVLDQLPVRCVGSWAYDKIYRLVQYFGIFASGMKNQWKGLNYVEICSGPGRCIIRDQRLEIDGTALSIITHPVFQQLKKALFVDANVYVVDALNSRIAAAGASSTAQAVLGDYTDLPNLQLLLAKLPPNCLNLAFIDPTECDLPFATVQAVGRQLKNADLLINVAIGTDATRNLGYAILDPGFCKAKSKYEAFLGSPGFCSREDVVAQARVGAHDDLRRLFMAEYFKKLASEGYAFTDACPVEHYYHLVFASRSPKGLEFWKKACRIDPDNQRLLL
jgi:three-Cys-motif partner protein